MRAKILVADDAPQYRNMLARSLCEDGFEVEAVDDGQEALEHIGEHSPDAVVCDIVMPRMSGFAVLEAVRQVNRRLPFILTSTWDSDCARQQAAQLGASAFVAKDTQMQELMRTVRRCVEQSASMPRPVAAPREEPLAEVRLALNNDPEVVLPRFCQEAACVLRQFESTRRVKLAQAVADAVRVAMCCGNLEIVPQGPLDSTVDTFVRRRAAREPYCNRQVVLLAVLEPRRLRVAITDQGRGCDYRTLEESHLAGSRTTFGRILFHRDGRSFELVHEYGNRCQSATNSGG